MKTLIILFLTIALPLQSLTARNYYVSSSNGNDNNSGTSTSAAWQTLTKLSAQILVAGDTVFFRRGDTFRGSLTVNQSGTAAQPIVFAAFGTGANGTGANPVLSGAERITAWSLNGSNYQAPVSQTVLNFFINDKAQVLARYPNEGQYLFLDSATKRSLTDRDLTRVASNLILGSKLCIHTAQWCWELESVGTFSGTTITYADSSELDALNGFGYFLYDNIAHLDTAKEWKYDAASRTLMYRAPNGINPSAVIAEASVYATGLRISRGVSNITVQDITFEKQGTAGIQIAEASSTNVKISRCAFNRQALYGVESNGIGAVIEYCTFTEVEGLAMAKNQGRRDIVRYNTFLRTGPFRNSGVGRQYNLSAVHLGFSDSNHVHHNLVDSAGYCGISADGKYNMIERNIVRNTMLLNNDGAALKSFGGQAQFNTFRNNFVEYSDGNTEGTRNGEFLTPGIYFDFLVKNCTVHENTVYNHTKKGIFQNAGNQNNTITNNVVFGSNYCLDLNGTQAQRDAITGMVVKNNVFLAFNSASYLIKQSDFTGTFNAGVLDSNFYYTPATTGRFAQRYEGNSPVEYGFAAWQAKGNDRNSRYFAPSQTSASATPRLFMNQTDNVLTQNLGDTLFLDTRGNEKCGSITLQPYTSKVLFQTTQRCTTITSVSEQSTNNEQPSGFAVYPSVASDVVMLQSRTGTEIVQSVSIFDAKGVPQSVETSGLQGALFTLDVRTLPPGMYVVQIGTSTGKRTIARFIKSL
jgi:hypothetical protein